MIRSTTGRPGSSSARDLILLPGCDEISRREFLAGLAAAAGTLALGGCGDGPSDPEGGPLPAPADSGIEHVVVLMMENRSFDHFLGWLPGADGVQAGLEFVDKQGRTQATHPLAPEFQSCGAGDPDQSYEGGHIQFDGGRCDGFLQTPTGDLFSIGYYTQDDLAFFGRAVPAWTTFDRYFCSILGPTLPNRLYQHAAQTDRLSNTLTISTLPTIWDRLAERGLVGRYYYHDFPVVALWGTRYHDMSHPYSAFLEDAAAGNLPDVAFVDPRFVAAADPGNSDHPFADIRDGQAFVDEVYRAVVSSPNWPNTVLVVNYDEWGGFYDHVPPPLAPLTALDPEIGNDGRLGFRIPCLVASPLARRGFIAREQYDHTSILRMIEWRWELDPLSVRDATANNLARVLDFRGGKDLRAPTFDVPRGPFGAPCTEPASLATRTELDGLRAMAAAHGFAQSPRR